MPSCERKVGGREIGKNRRAPHVSCPGMRRGEELPLPDGAHQPPAAAPAAGRGAADQGVILLWIQRGSDLGQM